MEYLTGYRSLFLKEELKNKSDSIIQYIQNLQTLNKSAKEEVDRLQKLIKIRTNKIERIKSYLISTMQILEQKKIETALGSYGIRKTPDKVEVYDLSALPKELIRIKEEKEPDKDKIKAYIKEHGEVAGARITCGYSLQIR
ncbi:siphovirus Gp157 family protein [Fusobacterium perfoetens]|nr:siphovirus Gp157 family protein [Fusobacterium perfoetens]